jgi:hypothetical protein
MSTRGRWIPSKDDKSFAMMLALTVGIAIPVSLALWLVLRMLFLG